MIEQRPKTIICDIDGTLVKHVSPLETCKPTYKMELLPGTTEKLAEWDIKGYNIILLSGRREGSRKETERQARLEAQRMKDNAELAFIVVVIFLLVCGGGLGLLVAMGWVDL